MDFMKMAIEGEDSEKIIKLQGPLSLVYKEALDIAYRKEDPPTNEQVMEILNKTTEPAKQNVVATETQVNDFLMGQEILKGIVNSNEVKPTTIFAISEDEVKPETPMVVNSLMNDSDDDQFILVVDSTKPATTDSDTRVLNQKYSPNNQAIIAAMESAVKKRGGVVAHSFKAAMEAMRVK